MQGNRGIQNIIAAVYLLIIALAASIPFYFESPSLFYKTGMDKFMLRAGKISGIIAAVLMIFQLVSAGRFAQLEKYVGLGNLIRYHRKSGLIILMASVCHPVLVLGADHFVFFPFESRYWPEFAGVFLFIILSGFILMSHWQKKTGLEYKTWKRLHQFFAPVLFLILGVHVVNVSRTFESGLPYYLLWAAMGIASLLIVRKLVIR